jgi:hypothetical protein
LTSNEFELVVIVEVENVLMLCAVNVDRTPITAPVGEPPTSGKLVKVSVRVSVITISVITAELEDCDALIFDSAEGRIVSISYHGGKVLVEYTTLCEDSVFEEEGKKPMVEADGMPTELDTVLGDEVSDEN